MTSTHTTTNNADQRKRLLAGISQAGNPNHQVRPRPPATPASVVISRASSQQASQNVGHRTSAVPVLLASQVLLELVGRLIEVRSHGEDAAFPEPWGRPRRSGKPFTDELRHALLVRGDDD